MTDKIMGFMFADGAVSALDAVVRHIDRRIDKLEKDKKGTKYVACERRRHPAWKQLNGRIEELKLLRKTLKGKKR